MIMRILVMVFAHGINKICKTPHNVVSDYVTQRYMHLAYKSLHLIKSEQNNKTRRISPSVTKWQQQIRHSETLLRRAATRWQQCISWVSWQRSAAENQSSNKQQLSTPAHFNKRRFWSLGGTAGSHTVCPCVRTAACVCVSLMCTRVCVACACVKLLIHVIQAVGTDWI